MKTRLLPLVYVIWALSAALSPAQAQEVGQYDVVVGGLRAGTLAYEADVSGNTYSLRGSARASGLVGIFVDSVVDVASRGYIDGHTLRPSGYAERTNNKGEVVRRDFRYRNGIPQITRTPPRDKPQKHAVAPQQQAGTLDPMSAAFAILRDKPTVEACQLDISMFDGAKRSRLQYTSREDDGDDIVCSGQYLRIAGFSPKEMAERASWPVTARYQQMPNGDARLAELRFSTSFGAARIRRR
ncbi:DUF3108 domain-containing protein [Qingshengfaniella alkalisoli]|uniref:DUF3108 domain-containing protein n=1 Tax=Qingshengfaniella alkalisoli TaxID=2599296 RepID=A0A5B8IWD2_9RHOB|nr:DUF3108 domain-containing protein [Qingshengfaniella alkalisoli]QDY69823.1 DUF3108 domain-containing protein [Qingshengfaniella alkalisoli]